MAVLMGKLRYTCDLKKITLYYNYNIHHAIFHILAVTIIEFCTCMTVGIINSYGPVSEK